MFEDAASYGQKLVTATLDNFVGKSIGEICSNHFTDAHQNHCAHFVSHALGLKLGMLCGDVKFTTKHTGASIRCDELYNGLLNKGPWKDRPPGAGAVLIFVVSARNIRNGQMIATPQKHVGIFFHGAVYNFSNTHHKVVRDASVDAFHIKFKHLYHGGDISLYYGVLT
jgi:hypothetical protein